jgi:raffinose/stachyose/melibiose transport system permease protein
VVQVGLSLVLAAILEAGLFSRRLSSFFRVSLFIPSILPITVVGFLWTLLYQPSLGLLAQALEAIGLGDLSRAWLGEEETALLAVVAVSQWQWTGYIAVLFVVAIRAIPRELYEAAALDGAGRIRQFWHVTVPGVRETTLLMACITIFGAIKVFDIVWVMTAGGPNNASEVLGTYMYRSAFRNDLVGYAAAVAVVIFVLTSAFGLVQIKLQRERA